MLGAWYWSASSSTNSWAVASPNSQFGRHVKPPALASDEQQAVLRCVFSIVITSTPLSADALKEDPE
jgi:hypothetical protein